MTFIAEMSVRTNSKLRAHGSLESNPTTLEQREEQYNDRSPFMNPMIKLFGQLLLRKGKVSLFDQLYLCTL